MARKRRAATAGRATSGRTASGRFKKTIGKNMAAARAACKGARKARRR